MQPYMSLTVHFINNDWILRSVCFQTAYFPEDHTGEIIAQGLKDALNSWNLAEDRLICMTTSVSNMIKALKDNAWPNLQCFGHRLHNAIENGVKDPWIDRAIGPEEEDAELTKTIKGKVMRYLDPVKDELLDMSSLVDPRFRTTYIDKVEPVKKRAVAEMMSLPVLPTTCVPDQLEQQDDLQYASVHFSNNRADPLYSNMRAARPLRHTEQQEVPEYAAVKFSSAAPREGNILDPCYTTIKGAYHAVPRAALGHSDHTMVHLIPAYRQTLKLCKPVVKTFRQWSNAPKLPSLSVSPSAEREEGSSVTLTCSSDANPAANYTWYKEDGN
ncbi:hypothetical protein JOQ06_012864, partial [Pogonophryne albipinna]